MAIIPNDNTEYKGHPLDNYGAKEEGKIAELVAKALIEERGHSFTGTTTKQDRRGIDGYWHPKTSKNAVSIAITGTFHPPKNNSHYIRMCVGSVDVHSKISTIFRQNVMYNFFYLYKAKLMLIINNEQLRKAVYAWIPQQARSLDFVTESWKLIDKYPDIVHKNRHLAASKRRFHVRYRKEHDADILIYPTYEEIIELAGSGYVKIEVPDEIWQKYKMKEK